MADGKQWIYENGEVREPTAEEHIAIEEAKKARGPLRPGDSVFLTIPAEHFEKFLGAEKLSDELALSVGRAFLAWTNCCDRVLGLFVSLSKSEQRIAEAIFNRIRSDKAQRDLLIDIGKIRLAERPSILTELQLALRELDALASDRNIFAHVSFGVHFDENWDARMKPSSAAKRWDEDKNATEVAEKLAADLRACGERLFKVQIQIE